MNATQKSFFYALFAFLAVGLAAWGQEVNFIEADLQPGGTVSELRQQHPECLAVSKDEFYQKCAELGGFENTDAAYRKLRPGKIKLPVAAKPEAEPTAVLQPIEEPAEEPTTIETLPVAPSAPKTVDEKGVSAGQVELANILFGPAGVEPLESIDWDVNILLMENESISTKLLQAENTAAQLEQVVSDLREQLASADQKVEVVEIPFPMEVEVARKQNLMEVAAEPITVTAAGMLLAIIFLIYSNQQHKEKVRDLAQQFSVAERSVKYWRARAKSAEQKPTAQHSAHMESELAQLRKIRDIYLYTFKLPGMRKGMYLEKADKDAEGNTLTVYIKGLPKPVPVDFIEDVLRINPEILKQLEEEAGVTLPETTVDPAVAKMRQERARELVAA